MEDWIKKSIESAIPSDCPEYYIDEDRNIIVFPYFENEKLQGAINTIKMTDQAQIDNHKYMMNLAWIRKQAFDLICESTQLKLPQDKKEKVMRKEGNMGIDFENKTIFYRME